MRPLAHGKDNPRDAHRPLRVTHLLKGLGPGGAERLVVNQLTTSDRTISYSVLRLIDEKDHLVGEVESVGALTAVVGQNGFWPLRLLSSLRELEPDIVHAHSPLLAAVVRIYSRVGLIDAVVVTTEHNRWPRHHRLTRLANRLTASLDAGRFAVSADVKETMDRRLQDSTVVLEHGVPIDQVRLARASRIEIRNELDIAADAIVIGIVANFRPEKSYDVLLEAASLALQTAPELVFVVVGQGPGEGAFRTAVEAAELSGSVRVLGYRADATAVMAAFDIFTLTSRHEGKPVSIMEAMALGLPVVATRAGGIPEMISDGVTGKLATIGDAPQLARLYVELAGDQALRSSLGTAAAEAASERFDASRSTRSIESRYNDV